MPRPLTARREARVRELRAAQILQAEMALAIGTLDLALARSNAKWLPSLADHRALALAWQTHWASLRLGRDLGHWNALQDAVDGVAPIHTSGLASGYYSEVRRVLIQRRERLVDATEILQVIIDGQRPPLRALELMLLAGRREKKWTRRHDLREQGPIARRPLGAAHPPAALRPCPPPDS